MEIKAIETQYNGYRFRSRLEARWAVFFDTLELAWEYESEGFVLPDGTHYLPDFKVTSKHGTVSWYEIKPVNENGSTKLELFKAAKLNVRQEESEEPNTDNIQTLCGDPVDVLKTMDICPRCGCIKSGMDYSDEWKFFDCWPCDATTPCGDGHPMEDGIVCKCYPHKGQWWLNILKFTGS